MTIRFAQVYRRLAKHGLEAVGTAIRPEDGSPPGIRTMVLATAAKQDAWQCFCASPEYLDGLPDPLDRWSRRVISAAANELGGLAFFPCEGPPYWPFLAWTRLAAPVWPSPLGIHIHADYGLWFSCRGAIGFRSRLSLPRSAPRAKPCDSCVASPCLSACPVDAFSGGSYDVDRCRAWVGSESGRDCRTHGCLARRACPVGDSFTHSPERAALHMDSFLHPNTSGCAAGTIPRTLGK